MFSFYHRDQQMCNISLHYGKAERYDDYLRQKPERIVYHRERAVVLRNIYCEPATQPLRYFLIASDCCWLMPPGWFGHPMGP